MKIGVFFLFLELFIQILVNLMGVISAIVLEHNILNDTNFFARQRFLVVVVVFEQCFGNNTFPLQGFFNLSALWHLRSLV